MNPILEIALAHESEFSDEFLDWLPSNLHVIEAFNFETFRIIHKGFKHYSGRTILEVLRHHSALQENSEPWKLNNNHTPYLCRLFAYMYPQNSGIFEYRIIIKPTRKFKLIG